MDKPILGEWMSVCPYWPLSECSSCMLYQYTSDRDCSLLTWSVCSSCRVCVVWRWGSSTLMWACCCGVAHWFTSQLSAFALPMSPCSWWPSPWPPSCSSPGSSNSEVKRLKRSKHCTRLYLVLCYRFITFIRISLPWGSSFSWKINGYWLVLDTRVGWYLRYATPNVSISNIIVWRQ